MTGERRDEWCPQEELAVGWAMHALEPDEEALLRAHLPGCARCQRAVRSTQEVTAVLGGSVHQEEPPPRLRSRLMAAVEHTPQVPAPVPHRPKHAAPVALEPRRRVPNRGRLLLAAAAVVVLAVGGLVGVRMAQLSDQVTAQTARTEQMQRVLSLAVNPDTNRALLRTDSGEAMALVLSSDNDAAVMPMKLQANDAQQIYVMWGTSTPSPVALATFDVPAGSSDPRVLSWSPDAHKHTGFAVSLEQGRTAPAAPSSVLAGGQVAAG